MSDDRQLGLLRDMLDSARAIQAYLQDTDYARSCGNQEKQDAVLRRLEIMGEAASRLNAATQQSLPELPVREMRGMRNIIVHDYGEVDLDQVWETCAKDLAPLVETNARYLKSFG